MLEKIVTNDRIKIRYEVFKKNSRTYVIFLHGGGGSLSAWEFVLPLFRNTNYTLITLDLRGHGLSDRPKNPNEYILEKHAEDILKLMQNERLKKVILVGHCLGSMVAATFAAKYPEKMERLILINTNYELPFFLSSPPIKQLLQFLLRLGKYLFPRKERTAKRVNYASFVGSSDLDIGRVRADLTEMGIYSLFSQGLALLDWKGRQYMEVITVPTLVISGSYDSLYSRGTGERVVELIHNAKLNYVDSNHISVLNNPKEVYDKILKFLKNS